MVSRFLLITLAFVLVATATLASPAGEDDTAAAEKEMVRDPATGKMVTAPEYGGTITFGTALEPPNSDPGQGHPGVPSWMFTLEKLGMADWALDRQRNALQSPYSPDFAITGLLAESWDWTDPVTLTVRIHSGVHWHDKAPMNGRELTAKDVEYNWHRYLGLGSGYTEVNPFVAQWAQVDDVGIVSVTATDDRTVVFQLKEPNIFAERTIIHEYSTHIAPPEVIEEQGDLLDWRNLVGTGPYELADWVEGSSLTFTKNPNYWKFDEKYPDNRLPYIDEVVWLIMPEESTRVAAFRSGQVDYLGSITNSTIQSLDVVDDLKQTNPEIGVWPFYNGGPSLAFNLSVEPVNDLRVRQAIQMALDAEAINDGYWKGLANTTPQAHTSSSIAGFAPPFAEWPEEIKKFYRHNPAEAEKLLDAAGYPRGDDGIRFKTNIEVRNVYDVNVYEIYAEQLLAVGIDAELQVMETAPWVSNINNKTYQSMTSATVANTWGQLTPLTHSVTGNAWQPGGPIANPEYDALVAAAQNASTLEEAQKASRDALLIMLENHWYTTAGEAPNVSVSQPWVKGFNGEYDLVSVGAGAMVARIWLDPDLKKSMGF